MIPTPDPDLSGHILWFGDEPSESTFGQPLSPPPHVQEGKVGLKLFLDKAVEWSSSTPRKVEWAQAHSSPRGYWRRLPRSVLPSFGIRA